jgi:hypothetical protein
MLCTQPHAAPPVAAAGWEQHQANIRQRRQSNSPSRPWQDAELEAIQPQHNPGPQLRLSQADLRGLTWQPPAALD